MGWRLKMPGNPKEVVKLVHRVISRRHTTVGQLADFLAQLGAAPESLFRSAVHILKNGSNFLYNFAS
jgi:hypothetical protein